RVTAGSRSTFRLPIVFLVIFLRSLQTLRHEIYLAWQFESRTATSFETRAGHTRPSRNERCRQRDTRSFRGIQRSPARPGRAPSTASPSVRFPALCDAEGVAHVVLHRVWEAQEIPLRRADPMERLLVYG